ncbi:MAG: hypothetical protein E6248_16410 [Clostridium sp.]|uniref:hypothetical protein n=1 Tax=Clostridium sp. TaxID=1506 RepID=UPI0029151CF2|nr:hypothetical protein [Clostridium sp.]MDU5112014.1 hypothetical protein [Clostridium sp.]
MLKSIEKNISIESNRFIEKATKAYVNTYYKDNNMEDFSYKKIIEEKSKTLNYIRKKRKEYKVKMRAIERSINTLENTYIALDIERNERIILVKNGKGFVLEEHKGIEDIENAMEESLKIIEVEKGKYKELKNKLDVFNDLSMEDERLVYLLFNYIRREFFRERKFILRLLDNENLNEFELILGFEFISIITKKILLVEEELLGG